MKSFFKIRSTIKENLFDKEIEKSRINIKRMREIEKSIEDLIVNRNELISIIIDSMPYFICYVDSNKRYKYVSKMYRDFFDLGQQDVIDKSIEEVLSPEIYSKIKDKIELAMSGVIVSYEEIISNKENIYKIEGVYLPNHVDNKVKGILVFNKATII